MPDPQTPQGADAELTAEEARDLADQLSQELYQAQDALAWVRELCDIADQNGQAITTDDVRKWLEGPKCGRQLLAEAAGATGEGTASPEHEAWCISRQGADFCMCAAGQKPRAGTRYSCPLTDCDWYRDLPSGLEDVVLARVTNTLSFTETARKWGKTAAMQIEQAIREHVDSHTVTEYLAALEDVRASRRRFMRGYQGAAEQRSGWMRRARAAEADLRRLHAMTIAWSEQLPENILRDTAVEAVHHVTGQAMERIAASDAAG